MPQLKWYVEKAESLAIQTVRLSQATVIAATDRVGRNSETDRPTALGRLVNLQLDVSGEWVPASATVTDRAYELAERLLRLQREFAARMHEAIDTREKA